MGKVRWKFPALLFVVTFLVYWPCVHNGFVSWDDDKNFLANFHYREFSPANLRWMFTQFHLGLYIPLSWLTLAADYALWGMNPAGYHFTSLFLHAIGAVLFYFLAEQLYALARPDSDPAARRWAAAFAAGLFALHPLRVESVVWITERRDVLSGIFFFASLLSYLRGARGISLAAFFCSLLSKPSTLPLPFLLLLLDFYPLRRRNMRSAVMEKIPFFALSIFFGWLAVHGQIKAGASASPELYNATQRLALMCYGDVFYLWKTLWPYHLSPFYRLPVSVGLNEPPFLWRALFVVGWSIFSVLNYRRWPAVFVVWFAYLALLSPTSGLFQSGPQIAADRYSYLSCTGWALLGGSTLLGPWTYIRLPMALVLVWLAILTRMQIPVWRDSDALWSSILRLDPENSFAHNNLGEDLRKRGLFPEAIAHLRTALELHPSAEIHYNLALALADAGQLDEATAEYDRALDLKPDYADAHYNLAMVFMRRGKWDDAAGQFRKTLEMAPEYTSAHNNLGVLLLSKGKLSEAAEEFGLAVQQRPDYADAWNNLGSALAAQGQLKEAIPDFEKALALNPQFSKARINLEAARAH